jgi:hypothetical protein
MAEKKKKYPSCFGVLELVFPKDQTGLRNSPDACLRCELKTACLRTAIKGQDGLRVREEAVDRAYASGVIGFLERWSRKKDYQRKINMQRSACQSLGDKHRKG